MKEEEQFYDEEFYFPDKKAGRKARKLASKLDRSKYKKTDQQKRQLPSAIAPSDNPSLLQGIVIKIQGNEIFVQSGNTTYCCSLRGTLKQERQKIKTLIIVGDHVFLEEHSQGEGVIVSICKRSTILSRSDHLSQQKEHLIAANVDLVFITTSVVNPPLRPSIIDRYLIAAHKGGLTAVIIVNKIDLLEGGSQEELLLKECSDVYKDIGIPFIATSASTGKGMDELLALMKDKISVFSGQSGSGKSSLINAAIGADLRVGKTVHKTKKGAHTTSYAELIPLPSGGYVVDTPGIKSFGVWGLEKEEVKQLFKEIAEAANSCHYTDCLHRGDPGCAIPKAIENGLVSKRRYDSYLNILASIEAEHKRR